MESEYEKRTLFKSLFLKISGVTLSNTVVTKLKLKINELTINFLNHTGHILSP